MATLSDAVSSFSQKFKRFNQAGNTERTAVLNQDQRLQQQIREREERLRTGAVQTYRIYKAPFEALGKNSERAAGIDRDEKALLDAYNLYKGVMEVSVAKSEEGEEVCTTYISSIEIASPLTQKASYTSGGQFVYLCMWLYFEQNCQEYRPVFYETEKGWSLNFVKESDYSADAHDRELFEVIRQEFYS